MNYVPAAQHANRIYPAQLPILLTRLDSLGLSFISRFQNLHSSESVLPRIFNETWNHMESHGLNILPRTHTEYISWTKSPFIVLKPGRRTPDNAYILKEMDSVHPPSYSGVTEFLKMKDTRVDEGGKRLLWICQFVFSPDLEVLKTNYL
jgi:hypothetical protein